MILMNCINWYLVNDRFLVLLIESIKFDFVKIGIDLIINKLNFFF